MSKVGAAGEDGRTARYRQYLEFCDETSMHGFADWKRSRLMRVFWIIIIILFFLIAFGQIFMMFYRYFNDPFLIETKPELLEYDHLWLPRIQFCLPMNVQKMRAMKLPLELVQSAVGYRLRTWEAVLASEFFPEATWVTRLRAGPELVYYNMSESIALLLDAINNKNVDEEVIDFINKAKRIAFVMLYDGRDSADTLINGLNDLDLSKTNFDRNQVAQLVLFVYAFHIQAEAAIEGHLFGDKAIPIELDATDANLRAIVDKLHNGFTARLLPPELSKENFDYIQLTNYLSFQPHEIFRGCTFMNKPFHCTYGTFESVYDPMHGRCFRALPNATFLMKQLLASNGLSVALNLQTSQAYDEPSNMFRATSSGVKIMFLQSDGSRASPVYFVPPATSASVSLKRTDIDRSVTESSDGCRSTSDSKILRVNNYTALSCQNDCYLQWVRARVGCIQPLPKDMLVDKNEALCESLEEWDNLQAAFYAFDENELSAECLKLCRPACTETQYEASVTYNGFPSSDLANGLRVLTRYKTYKKDDNDNDELMRAKLSTWFYDDLASVTADQKVVTQAQENGVKFTPLDDLTMIDRDTCQIKEHPKECVRTENRVIDDWAKQHIIIHFSYPSHQITRVAYSRRMSFEDFFGQVGGFLGLWTGASIMSFIHGAVFLVQFCFPQLDPLQPEEPTQEKPASAKSAKDPESNGKKAEPKEEEFDDIKTDRPKTDQVETDKPKANPVQPIAVTSPEPDPTPKESGEEAEEKPKETSENGADSREQPVADEAPKYVEAIDMDDMMADRPNTNDIYGSDGFETPPNPFVQQ